MAEQEIAKWLEVLEGSELPVFGATAGKLSSIASDEKASAIELSRVILCDPNMTAKVLKIANSVYYNPQQLQINTISRAVVLLGFDAVHGICLSVSIVDTLLKSSVRNRLLQEVTQAVHAAIQAKSMVKMLGNGPDEEIFIAALLYHIGDMAFWCFGENHADELALELEQSVDTQDDLARDKLGFTFKDLTTALVDKWKLGDTITTALSDGTDKPAWAQCIDLGYELAENLAKGWDHQGVPTVIGKVAKHLKMQKHQIEQIVQNNAMEAIRQAKMYKIGNAEQFIPLAEDQVLDDEEANDAEVSAAIEADELLQLSILRDLSAVDADTADLNMVLQLIIEGLHRGVGLDRVSVAIISSDRSCIRSKYVLSSVATDLADVFRFNFKDEETKIFVYVIKKHEYVWVGNPKSDACNKLLTNSLVKKLHTKNFYLAPVLIGDNAIGVFYADRQPSHRDLDDTSFSGFQHFTRQANMALRSLMKKK